METILVLDFGGQYNQLIARRVRECNVYCEVKPYTTPLEELKAMQPKGFIFTGGPNSVYDAASPKVDPAIFTLGVPVLGICYGMQLLAFNLSSWPRRSAARSRLRRTAQPANTAARRRTSPPAACSRVCPSRASPG